MLLTPMSIFAAEDAAISESADIGFAEKISTEEDPDALPEGYVDNSNDGMFALQAEYENQNSVQLMSGNELAGKKVEIAFLIDASGSMSPYIAKVKENVTAMAQYFESAGVNLRMAVVRYGASEDGRRANVLKINGSSWHTSTSQLVETLSNMSANGGTEALSDAIGDMLNKNPFTNNTDLQWSSDAYKFAFVLTNDFDTGVEGLQYNDYGYGTLNATIPDLQKKRIYVSVVTRQYEFSRYNNLASETGGELYDIASPDYLQLLIDYANKCMGVALKATKAIYVLPGYLGSQLYDNNGEGELLWNKGLASWGIDEEEEGKRFINNEDGSRPDGNVDIDPSRDNYGTKKNPLNPGTYKSLVERLKNEFDTSNSGIYDVKFFPYNWLGDLNDSVKSLESDINRNGYDKVVFVTHSTGGLLASAYVAQSVENKRKVEKAVLIAAPLFGTYASLLPIERGDSKKGSFALMDAFSNNKWVKSWAKNSPTTYQLLPSEEYLEHYPLTDKGGFGDDEKQISTMDGFYGVLNQSDNINTNLTNGNNRSHKYFRETVLKNNVVNEWSISPLKEIDVTLIATPVGHDTPISAIYKEPVIGEHRKLSDIKYNTAGDGTVAGISSLALNKYDPGIKFNDVEYFSANHTDLVSDDDVLDTVCDKISAVSNGSHGGGGTAWSRRSLALMGIEQETGMSNKLKIRYECDVAVTATVYNSNGEIVASATGDIYNGFENGLIYDNFADDEAVTEASIYIPNAGYKIVFTCGETAGTALQFTSEISTLNADGDKDLSINSTFNTTLDGGVIVSLDGTAKDLTNESITQTIDGDVVDRFTQWNLPLSIKINLNDVQKINIEGTEAEAVSDILNWESSDTDIVEISNDGTITAKGYGKAIISASNGDKVETTEVTVMNNATAVTLGDLAMVIGERTLIRPTFAPVNATETDLIYTTNKGGIIEIDEFGVIHALKAGSVTVTGKTSYGVEDSFVVVVEDDTNYAVESIEISPSTISVTNGGTATFQVKFTPENATNKELNWLIEDESLISITNVDEKYVITGLKEGTTKITAISVDGGYTSDAIVEVSDTSPSYSSGASIPSYTVKFNTNGGSKVSNKIVTSGESIKKPNDPIKDGYTFDGWYTDKDCTNKFNFNSSITKKITLYAKWIADEDSKIILTLGKKEAIVFGETIENDVEPKVVNQRTMLPIRFVAEALGAEVIWKQTEPDKVVIKKDDIEIIITLGSDTTLVNGKKVSLDSPAFAENSRTYLPLRFVAENLGANVEWVQETQQVIITK